MSIFIAQIIEKEIGWLVDLSSRVPENGHKLLLMIYVNKIVHTVDFCFWLGTMTVMTNERTRIFAGLTATKQLMPIGSDEFSIKRWT